MAQDASSILRHYRLAFSGYRLSTKVFVFRSEAFRFRFRIKAPWVHPEGLSSDFRRA
jgi:hypothetical protein